MIGLPKSTEFNKRIPKQKFYENINISPALKKIFVEQVKIIYWKNKIASSTTNLACGNNVTEIEVFEIRLNSKLKDDNLMRQIDKEIPYHILFILEYEGKYQAWIGYKEESKSGKNAFKVNSYYNTEWMNKEELQFKINGLNLDSVYENFIRQIAGDRLGIESENESLKESIDRDEKIKSLEKKISKLKAKMKKEKQFNKQVEINAEVKKLRKEIERINVSGTISEEN